jgi:hypothetical protein
LCEKRKEVARRVLKSWVKKQVQHRSMEGFNHQNSSHEIFQVNVGDEEAMRMFDEADET